jgi:hypothetical protein
MLYQALDNTIANNRELSVSSSRQDLMQAPAVEIIAPPRRYGA